MTSGLKTASIPRIYISKIPVEYHYFTEATSMLRPHRARAVDRVGAFAA